MKNNQLQSSLENLEKFGRPQKLKQTVIWKSIKKPIWDSIKICRNGNQNEICNRPMSDAKKQVSVI